MSCMKKKHLAAVKEIFVICIVFFSFKSYAQTDNRVIDWQDFQKSTITSKIADPVKWQNFTVFTIKNINKFLYKVEISGNVFELQLQFQLNYKLYFDYPLVSCNNLPLITLLSKCRHKL